MDNQLREKRRVEDYIEEIENLELDEARKELEVAKTQWQDIVERG